MLRAMHARFILVSLLAAACGGGARSSTTPPVAAVVTVETLTRTLHSADADADATISVPHVTVPGNPSASAAINGALGVPTDRAALDAFELQEAGLGFEVGFNRDGLLDLSIVHETMGAYPDGYVEHFLFDTATGARLSGAALIAPDQAPALIARLDGELQASIAKARTDHTDCIGEDDDPYAAPVHFTAADLEDLGLSDTGAYFTVDFDFPHVIQACEPDGTFRVDFATLAPFLAPGTPLARLQR